MHAQVMCVLLQLIGEVVGLVMAPIIFYYLYYKVPPLVLVMLSHLELLLQLLSIPCAPILLGSEIWDLNRIDTCLFMPLLSVLLLQNAGTSLVPNSSTSSTFED